MWKGQEGQPLLVREEEVCEWSFSMGGPLWSLWVGGAGPLMSSSKAC